MPQKSSLLVLASFMALVGVTLITAACSEPKGTTGTDPSAAVTKPLAGETAVSFTGKVSVDPTRAPVGTVITVSGTGFPTEEGLELMWHTVEGSWDIRGDYREEYHGRVFTEIKYPIAEVKTDAHGGFSATLTVPEDYGFNHNITVEHGDNVLNRAGFAIVPTATIQPTSGPVGTPITLTMKGIGWQQMENSWTLMYDNNYTGFLSAVTTRGTAEAVIPATGKTGKHILRILHGAFQYPYLNTEQNPRPDQPVFTMEFAITAGPAVLPAPAEEQGFAVRGGTPSVNTGTPSLWVDPVEGPIGTPFTVYGRDFPSGQNVQFVWYSVVGNRVSGTGWDETSVTLGMAAVGADGTVSQSFTAPDDLGGDHRIEAIIAGEKVTKTGFVITPSILPLGVSSAPVGTSLTVHLKGVGWTETANIYHLVYDNSYLGYACGFNSQGDVTIHLPLTGEPGWHFIDLYPGIYKGKEVSGVQDFRVPQLTYEADHPGERLPAFHLAVSVQE